MTLAEIREWYEANKTHTMYDGHWCRTCSIGALLDELDRDGVSVAHDLQKVVLDWYFGPYRGSR